MKFLIVAIEGFALGICVAAMAGPPDVSTYYSAPTSIGAIMAGRKPNGDAGVIQLDVDGYVICSDHHKGETK
jgi:hypothetical protein